VAAWTIYQFYFDILWLGEDDKDNDGDGVSDRDEGDSGSGGH